MILHRATSGSVSFEHLTVLAAALFGVVGMTSLGTASRGAIAGDAAGAPGKAALAAPLSVQAGAASTVGAAAKDLYRGVKGKARPPMDYPRLAQRLQVWVASAQRGEAIPLREIKELGGAGSNPTTALIHGLLNEYARLAKKGDLTRNALLNAANALNELNGRNWSWSGGSPLTGEFGIRIVTYYADEAAQYGVSGPAEKFFERVRAADQIFRDGITPAQLKKLFPDYSAEAEGAASVSTVRAAAPSDDLAEFLGTFDGPTSPMTVFEWQYLANPERALLALTDEARGYLEAEVLPILRATYAKKEESLRYLTDEGEARVMSRLVRGDADGAKKALAAGKKTGSPALPGDMAEAVTFASRLFSGGDAPFGKLRAFSDEEASTLVRFSDDVIEDLRTRTDGGALVADLADVLRGRDWTRAAGRAEAHQTKALESLLQAVARGSEDDFNRAHGFVTQVVSDFGKDLADELKQLMVHFRGEPAVEAPKSGARNIARVGKGSDAT